MKCRIAIFALIFLALLAQVSVLSGAFGYAAGLPGLAFLRGHTFEISLAILIYLGFQRSFGTGILWACAATILVQTFGIAWKGSIHSSYFAVIVLANLLKRAIHAKAYGQKFAIAFLFSLCNAWAQLFFGGAFERFGHAFSGMAGFILVQALINAALTPFVFRGMFLLERAANPRGRRDENVFYQTDPRRGFASY